MFQTLRQARSLAGRPAFTLLVVFIMALCIGGNAAVFSGAKAVLFQPLPYKDADRLVLLSLVYLPNGTDNDLSYAEAIDWNERITLLDEMSPLLYWQERLLIQGDVTDRVGINFVPPSYFRTLGIEPHLGRHFTEEESGTPGSAPVVLLSHELWERSYGKDPAILGKLIRLNDLDYTVVGVLPEGFRDLTEDRWGEIDVWAPSTMAAVTFGGDVQGVFEAREARSWFSLGRIKEGVTLEQAQEEVRTIAGQMQREFPESTRDYGARLIPIREYIFADLHGGMEILLTGALFVLLIGCANVASLLLARVAERREELSLHLALGAGRWRLVKSVLVESLILAGAGGALGVLLAIGGTEILSRIITLPPMVEMELDGEVLLASLIATVMTGLLFGLPPAIGATRTEAKGALLVQRGRSVSGRPHTARSRNAILVFQVAVVVTMLVVAGLLLRSFLIIHTTGVDFATDGVLSMRLNFDVAEYEHRPNITAFGQEAIRRLEGVPGVVGAAVWGTGIPGITLQYSEVQREGASEEEPTVRAFMNFTSPGALEVLDIPLVRGRDFTPRDNSDVPQTAIISQSLAQRLWPEQDPIGKRLTRTGRADAPWSTVIGVIRDTRLQGRFAESGYHLIFSQDQRPTRTSTLLVRTATKPGEELADTLRKVVREVDPGVPVFDVAPLEHRLADEEASFRLNATVVGMYSVLSLLFALLGIYGTLSYSVTQRTREIGVRMALGARAAQVIRMVMGRGLVPVVAGLVLGLVATLAFSRLMSSLLFGITDRDPFTFTAVAVVFIAVALVATYLPARQALRIEPVNALRHE